MRERSSVVWVLAWLLTGCGADRPPRVVVERVDSAGVEIVWNRGADVPLDWRFTRVLTLGGEEQGEASFYRASRTSVGVDGAGNLYVLDTENPRVVVFDRAGAHLRTMGRQGGGPGEFLRARNMSVALDGTVSVYDMGKRAVVRFAPSGEVLEEQRLEIPYQGPLLVFTEQRVVFHTLKPQPGGVGIVEGVAEWRQGEVAELYRHEGVSWNQVEFQRCGVRWPAAPIFAPTLVWDAAGPYFVASGGSAYAVAFQQEGKTARSLRRDAPPRGITEAMALQEAGEGHTIRIQGRECVIPPAEYIAKLGYASALPAIAKLVVGPNGEVWVQRGHVRGEPALIDVFDAKGGYRGTLPPDSPFPVVFLPDGGILAVEKDDMDVMRVVSYRVERGR